MKKFFFLFVPAILIAFLVYLMIQYVSSLGMQKGALQVTSYPVSKVYLNGNYIGRTPISKTDSKDMIQSGSYSVKLVPEQSSLSEYQEKITISTGTLTVVDRKFIKGSLAEGYVISLFPLTDKSKSELEVISFPSGSRIELDAGYIGNTPILYKKPTESDHILKIEKDGYKEKAVRIRTPIGYRLTVVAYLGVKSEADKITLTPSPSPSIATPSPSPGKTKILILNTPTGFLNVRKSFSLSSPVVTTVLPGEIYELIDEQGQGWYEIKLPNNMTGWISSQYAKKQ